MVTKHSMPFGADVLMDGGVRFRLWAPAAKRVTLCLENGSRADYPLLQPENGWFERIVPEASAGSLYRFQIDDKAEVPDPASRFQPQDVQGPSEVVDPTAFQWGDPNWRGRPWEEAVFYELHVGTFSPEGTFRGVEQKLDYLRDLGVTAVELMPLEDFSGARNWGYDGVLPFAPDSSYGRPEDLKQLVQAAHARGLMMFLDVVYNHFGPEGNYLHGYAPQFFNPAHVTPWGAAINYDGERARVVRDFFIHNALYWLEEFHFDGLRLDAVHAIADDSRPDVIDELAAAVRAGPGQQREVHIVLENDRNEAARLVRSHGQPRYASAQWNDDVHHAFHVLATGERDGYYRDYAKQPLWWLGRALAQGFGYQGEISQYRGGCTRGEISSGLPPSAFVNFIQNHDQIGNRALGERLSALVPAPVQRLETVCLLLAPSVPLLFMGEEFAASSPFLFFCDFGPELAPKVVKGRREEFAAFERFRTPQAQACIPNPGAEQTFTASKLDWNEFVKAGHAQWHTLFSDLLELRRRRLVPHLAGSRHEAYFAVDGAGLSVDWTLGDGSQLHLRANFSEAAWANVPD